jgi:hypothetical protein
MASTANNLLRRELRFKTIAGQQIQSYAFAYVLVGIPMAALGQGAWSLVAAWLCQSVVGLLLALRNRPHAVRPLLRVAAPREYINVGAVVFCTNICNWLVSNADRLLIGRLLGTQAAGFYAVGYNLATGPNGLMISAIKALRIGARCVLIIDGDGHYGDGTQDIIEHLQLANRVRHVTRPAIGEAQSRFSTPEWGRWAQDLIERHKPGIIMYQAGADAWVDDPYGAGYLTQMGLAQRDRGIFLAARIAGVPLVWNLAGGYSETMQQTIDIHLMTLQQSDEVLHATAEAKTLEPELS